jgi:hypothetical protein
MKQKLLNYITSLSDDQCSKLYSAIVWGTFRYKNDNSLQAKCSPPSELLALLCNITPERFHVDGKELWMISEWNKEYEQFIINKVNSYIDRQVSESIFQRINVIANGISKHLNIPNDATTKELALPLAQLVDLNSAIEVFKSFKIDINSIPPLVTREEIQEKIKNKEISVY